MLSVCLSVCPCTLYSTRLSHLHTQEACQSCSDMTRRPDTQQAQPLPPQKPLPTARANSSAQGAAAPLCLMEMLLLLRSSFDGDGAFQSLGLEKQARRHTASEKSLGKRSVRRGRRRATKPQICRSIKLPTPLHFGRNMLQP